MKRGTSSSKSSLSSFEGFFGEKSPRTCRPRRALRSWRKFELSSTAVWQQNNNESEPRTRWNEVRTEYKAPTSPTTLIVNREGKTAGSLRGSLWCQWRLRNQFERERYRRDPNSLTCNPENLRMKRGFPHSCMGDRANRITNKSSAGMIQQGKHEPIHIETNSREYARYYINKVFEEIRPKHVST